MMTDRTEETTDQWIDGVRAPAALVLLSYRLIDKYFARELAPHNIGWGPYAILMSLYEIDGRTLDGLVKIRRFNKATVTRSVTKLEKEGIATRKADPKDKETIRLFLTKKGKTLEPEMKRVGASITKLLLAGLDEKEAATALEGVRKIARNTTKL